MKMRKGWKLTNTKDGGSVILDNETFTYLRDHTIWGQSKFKGWIKERAFILS